MSKVIFKAKSMQFKNGCLLLPATPADRRILDQFCNEATSHIVTVTANYSRSNKTYDQCKTVFALTAILFECNYDRVPSGSENERLYRELLEEYAPREESLLDPNKTTPIPLSRMNKREAAEFINALINLIMENCDLTDKQQIDVKQIFEEFQSNNSFGVNNPTDYHKDGTMLTEEEWRKKNNFSFASGVKGTDECPLHLHHILTRHHAAAKDCSWNWVMLLPSEHDFYHQNGYEKFLEVYPNLAKRVKNAFDEAHALYTLELQKALIKLGLIDDMLQDTVNIEEKDITDEALEAASDMGGLF